MSGVPGSRELGAVLARALEPGASVRLELGRFGAADPSASYCNVIIGGVTMRVPMFRGVVDTPGAAAYLLATGGGLMVCIGTVAP